MSPVVGRLTGAGHDLARRPVAAHGVDRHRQRAGTLTGRPGGAPRH